MPPSIRHASLALGATQWQTVRRQVLPAAIPGIATGAILALSRAIGEAAPLIMIGAFTYVRFNPTGLDSQFTVLPIQIFNWIDQPQAGFPKLAAAASMLLLIVLVAMNSVAIWLRNRYRKNMVTSAQSGPARQVPIPQHEERSGRRYRPSRHSPNGRRPPSVA